MTLEERREENSKLKGIDVASKFQKSLPEEFGGDILRKGDVITLPKEYIFNDKVKGNVFTQEFGKNANGEPITAEFILATLTRNGVDSTINFFPSSMIKNIFVSEMVNDEVQLKMPVLRPLGSAVEKIFSFRGKGTTEKTDFQMAVESLAGAKIHISEDTVVKTQKWKGGKAQNALKDTHVYTYDLV